MPTINEIDFGRGEAANLRRAALEEILKLRQAIDPTGQTYCRTIVRFIYYRLVARRVVPKDSECKPKPGINPRSGKPYKSRKPSSDYVSEALNWLRVEGWVDDSEIVDESRSSMNNVGFASVKDGLLAYLPVIEIDPWDGNPPVLVVESRSLQSFFGLLAAQYRIDIICLGGQASRGYLANDACKKLRKDTLVLAAVDYDKAGGDIENSARKRLKELAPYWLATSDHWRRVAVTDEQFQEYGVRQDLKIIKEDDRFSPPRAFETLEAEGVEQEVLEASVRDALAELLYTRTGVHNYLDHVRAEEQRQREEAEKRIKKWRIA